MHTVMRQERNATHPERFIVTFVAPGFEPIIIRTLFDPLPAYCLCNYLNGGDGKKLKTDIGRVATAEDLT